MISRYLHVAGTAALGLVVLLLVSSTNLGCAQQNSRRAATPPAGVEPVSDQQPQPQAKPVVQPDASGAKVDEMEASRGTTDALARKAESYSREMESLLANRSNKPDAGDAPAVPAPSQVKWADPGELSLGSFSLSPTSDGSNPAAQSHEPTVRPVIETARSEANRVASAVPIQPPVLKASSANANAPADGADEPSTKPATTPTAPRVSSSPGQAGPLADKLASRVRDYPRDVSAHLEYQLLQFLLDEQVPQLTPLASLPAEDRELVSAVLDGLSLFRSTLRSDNNMLLSKKIRPLIDMADRLRSQADLMIPAAALCRSVEGFGKYEPLEPARFAAGKEHKAIIYCEVANFASNLNERQMWETRLKQDLVLYTEFGAPVWNDRTETIIDSARNRRHDFFVNKRIVIPANLTIGRYLLKVSIVDTQANRVAEATVPLVIAAQ
jgi:hypothetical protein